MLGFGQKLLNTQWGVGGCTWKSPIMKWAKAFKESLKKIHWSQRQPLTTMPTGTVTQMGSQNTHLQGKHVPPGACPPEDNSILGVPRHISIYIHFPLLLKVWHHIEGKFSFSKTFLNKMFFWLFSLSASLTWKWIKHIF